MLFLISWRFIVPLSSGSGSPRYVWRCPDMICMTLNFNNCDGQWWVFTKKLLDSCGFFIVYVGRCDSWLISIVNLCYLTFCTLGRQIICSISAPFLLKASFNISLLSVTVLASLPLILLTWRIWWANNASRWQMGFNLVFKGLKKNLMHTYSTFKSHFSCKCHRTLLKCHFVRY